MTMESVDEYFAEPYVDVDEWRDAPVRHRYVHGGFANTETRFSIYLPPAAQYGGRFFQHITPVPDSEHLAQGAVGEQDRIGFSIDSGAYFLETNGGGESAGPGLAAQMYGEHRSFGYAYGGSGGGFRTIGGAENTTGVWDGVVPYVIGSPMAIPNMFTVRMHAMRVLRHSLDRIVDAVEPGGSGDMYAGLSDEERAALVEVTRMGFPPRSWFGHRTMGMHAFPVLYGGVRIVDPTYFEDFWRTPGYLGHSSPPSFQRDIVMQRCEVIETLTHRQATELGLEIGRLPGQIRGGVDTAWQGADEPAAIPAVPVPVAARLSSAVGVDVIGAELIVISGAAAGNTLGLLTVVGNIAIFGPGDIERTARLQPGDIVEVDNRGYLAAQTYHRHQVPGPDYPVWDQFRNPDGSPIYPQRPLIIGPLFAAGASGTVQTGRFEGKMIVVAALLDREAMPWQADWYRSKVTEHLGDATDDHFRLWYVDNALHGDDEEQEDPTHTISYLGVLHQALRDVAAWAEQGIAPPSTTSYEVVDGQVVVPADANLRRGVQPVVTLTADSNARADVAIGDEVVFRAVASVPAGTGEIVNVEWDFDGTGFTAEESVVAASQIVVERRHAFAQPGTYFPTVRVVGQRTGDSATPYARLYNLARTRIVVT
jgi:hypothetical protein